MLASAVIILTLASTSLLRSDASVVRFQQTRTGSLSSSSSSRSRCQPGSRYSTDRWRQLTRSWEADTLRGRPDERAEVPCSPAQDCNRKRCKLPCCFCSATGVIPGDLAVRKVPQMVTLTFQTAVTRSNYPAYDDLFRGRLNPNNCSASGTFFVSHEHTDYRLVNQLYRARHEIGVNSITWKASAQDWVNATEMEWEDEMGGQRKIIAKYANVTVASIRGMRAPYLQMGGNNQVTALEAVGLTYDSTRSSARYVDSGRLLWPYTYDYASIQDCPSGNCPNCSFPGSWEVPLLGFRCPDGRISATADGCPTIKTQTQAYQLLLNKFQTHYNSSTRAPMVVSIGSAWMSIGAKVRATKQFLDYLANFKDVYVIPAGQVIDWIQKPTPLASLSKFEPWKCKDERSSCINHSDCIYDRKRKLMPPGSTFAYRLQSCIVPCPACYPWIGDAAGKLC